MARNSRQVTFFLGVDATEFVSGMKKAQKQIQDISSTMQKVGSGMSRYVSAPLLGLGAAAIHTAGNFEQLKTSLSTLVGSAEEGARVFKRLQDFSAATPFQLNDIVKANNTLLGFSLSADGAYEALQNIGDIAAVTGGDMQAISIAFGQAAAEGRVMTQDIRQFINQGVPAIKMLADTMGVAENQVLDLASQGKISFDILQQSFRQATSEGGLFADGMEKQSRTINGLLSTLKDNASIALGELGEAIVDAFDLRTVVKNTTESIGKLIKWFKGLSDEAKRTIILVTTGIVAIGPTLTALGFAFAGLGIAIGALTSPITLIIGAIAGISAAVLYVVDNWEVLKERVSNISWWKNTMIAMIEHFIRFNPFEAIINGYNALLAVMGQVGVSNPFDNLRLAMNMARDESIEFEHQFGSMTDAVLSAISKLSGVNIADLFTPSTPTQLDTPSTPTGKSGGVGTVRKASAEVAQISAMTLATVGSLSRQTFETVVFTARDISNSISYETMQAMERTAKAMYDIQPVVNTFVNSFGQGMANIVLQGENLIDVLKNIGKLLASALIQKAISVFLTGGLASGGEGFFGSGGGLFGKIFGVNDALIQSNGNVVKFHPDDNILAMKDFGNLKSSGGGSTKVELIPRLLRISNKEMVFAFEQGKTQWER